MSNWKQIAIKEIVLEHRPVTYGIVQPGPDIRPNGIPLIRGRDYSSGIVNTTDLYHVKPEIDLPYKRSRVLPNDILFSIAGYVGQVAVVPESLSGANITQTTARISVDINAFNSQYIFYYLVSEFTQIQVRKYAKGSAQEGLNLSDVEKIELKFPSINEQRKIAQILSTTDTVIQKTQAAIGKYKAIKQGMLHDLFTRGIDLKTGKLRPKYEDAPELYKESKLGWIPKNWDEYVLGDIGYTFGGLTNKSIGDFGFGKPFIPYMNVFSNGSINTKFLNLVNINPGERQNTIKYGDLFFTTSSETVEEVGMTSVLLEDIGEAYLNSFCFGFRLDNFDLLLPEYAAFLFRNNVMRKKISLFGQGSTRYNLPKTELIAKLNIALPNINEQCVVNERLLVIENKIKTEQNYLQKLYHIKAGLMADLLSGKKLVTVTNKLETEIDN
jgi:type I restriction enzyme S subunit